MRVFKGLVFLAIGFMFLFLGYVEGFDTYRGHYVWAGIDLLLAVLYIFWAKSLLLPPVEETCDCAECNPSDDDDLSSPPPPSTPASGGAAA